MSKKDNNDSTNDTPNLFPEKWNKVLKEMPDVKETLEAASVDELKKVIVTSEGNIYNIEREKAEHVKYNAAKEILKELGEPFKLGVRAETAKIKYALFLLEGKGQDTDSRNGD